MRRVETYVGQQVYEWLFSAQAQNGMTAMAKVCAALFGTGGTVNGLPCTPTSPATMTVQIGAGEIYQMENLEATACGTLPANTAYQILKQGIQLGTYTTTALAAPTTSGQSINYLIQAQYQDSDISLDPTTGNAPVVLQFYNAGNPSTPWSGPNNSGATSNTFRDGIIAYQIVAGTAATTGSQVTPSPTTGWIGLWVVTVPYGATSLTSSNISQYTGSPILPSGVLQSIVTSNLTYGLDSGSANTIQAKFPIPVTTLVDGMDVWVKVAAANTGATTFTPNPGVISAAPVIGAAHQPLQGGETIAGGRANLVYRADVTSWVLVECTGAATQVSPATQSQHAVQFGQLVANIGDRRNLLCDIPATSASATFTAESVVVGTAVGGLLSLVTNLNASINLGTVGAGGMDVSGLPATSSVAVYLIRNQVTGAVALLGQNASAVVPTSVYSGAAMPSGYTQSALLTILLVTSSQFGSCYVQERHVTLNQINQVTTGSSSASNVLLSLGVPYGAKAADLNVTFACSAVTNANFSIGGTSTGTLGTTSFQVAGGSGSGAAQIRKFFLRTIQTVWYSITNSAGSPTTIISLVGYDI